MTDYKTDIMLDLRKYLWSQLKSNDILFDYNFDTPTIDQINLNPREKIQNYSKN